MRDAHVKLLSDNTTTVDGIHNMHPHKSDLCQSIISELWVWAEEKDIWITASYIPGKNKYDADRKSRKRQTKLEWMLNQKTLTKIMSNFQFQPELDLLASRLNIQLLNCPVFVSYHPNTEAMHINAFSISSQCRPFYAFPPFVVIRKVLHKIVLGVATGIIVVPNWSTQPWYSLLMKLLIDIPISLRSSKFLLQIPAKSKPHPLANKLNLLAYMISGKNPRATNLSAESISIIQQRRFPSTTKRCDNYIGKWKVFCHERRIDPISPSLDQLIEFLTKSLNPELGTHQ